MNKFQTVVVHPLVLLSVVDHYTRVAKDTRRRVVGVLLGESFKGKLDITNSYAVPFEEDPKDPNVWYIDRQYHEEMFAMFKKVNAKEKIVGWYSTGPKLKESDLDINEMFRSYSAAPVLVIVDVNARDDATEIPTDAYVAVEAPPEEKSALRRQWQHLSSEIGAYEAEEVGVEHLLRNIRDTTITSTADHAISKISALKAMHGRLVDIHQYLENVKTSKLPINHQIIAVLQDITNLLPDLSQQTLVDAFTEKTNDKTMVLYVASIVRSILALHDLISNKIDLKDKEKATEAKKVAIQEVKSVSLEEKKE